MLNDITRAFLCYVPENSDFRAKRGVLIISMLRQCGFVKKAERAVLQCNKAVIALRRRPYCNAKRPLRECREALTACLTCKKGVSRKQRRPPGFSISRKKKS